MNPRNNLVRWLILALALAALSATAAQAGTRPNKPARSQHVARDNSDVLSRYLRSHSIRSDDRAGSRGGNSVYVPSQDVFERYASAHPYGAGLAAASVADSDGFRWDDYGAGVGTGIVVVLLLAGGLLATPIRRRHRTQPAIGR
jgi:hypothetical protein